MVILIDFKLFNSLIVVTLKPEFLKKFTELEEKFQALLGCDSKVLEQFEDFLSLKFEYVEDMTVSEFFEWILNYKDSDHSYVDLQKYFFPFALLILINLVVYTEFSLFWYLEVLNVKEDSQF